MSTARTCTTPEDGWALYSHFLGNLLLVIASQGWREERGEEETEDQKDKREKVIGNAWAQLVGNLYMIMRRMKLNGHDDVAAQMQEIVDMVVEQDLTDPAVREAIHARRLELNVTQREFEKVLKQLQDERGMI